MYGAAAAWRRRVVRARPVAAAPAHAAGHQRRQPARRRQRQDADGRHTSRGCCSSSGERPAILTRGYGGARRATASPSCPTATRVLADLDQAGDEPLMLARALPGVRVLVGADRYLSGLLAERQLGATVHLLDDGFQHLELARDVDLLLVAEDDLQDQPLPAGRLRERISAATAADAALVTAGYDTAAERIGRALGVSPVVSRHPRRSARRGMSPARAIRSSCPRVRACSPSPASPGPTVSSPISRRPAGRWPASSSSAITTRSRRATSTGSPPTREAAGSALILTTEKDAVRLAACDLGDLPIASVPLVVGIEPAGAFAAGCSIGFTPIQHRSNGDPSIRIDHPQSTAPQSDTPPSNPQSATRNPQ